MRLVKTDSHNATFKTLVKELDAYLAVTDGDEHSFYNQFNKLDHINHVIIAFIGDVAVGCGAIKEYNPQSMEIKRMYTKKEYRSHGIASRILNELEQWAIDLSYKRCILETGVNQREAIVLYRKNHYLLIDNYGQYVNMENSFCFEKKLS